MDSFTARVKRIIGSIPAGRVSTYGQIALLAGNVRAARQVAWVLHTSSSKDRLPWHRVIKLSIEWGKYHCRRGAAMRSRGPFWKARGCGSMKKTVLIWVASAGVHAWFEHE
jgi:alkylated DNA nucleotide flippase Atl1